MPQTKRKWGDERYFSIENRKEQKDQRIRRLNLATCGKRLTRRNRDAVLSFIPLDPVNLKTETTLDLETNELKTDGETLQEKKLRYAKEFNEELRRDPKNIQLWLKFIAFQPQVMIFSSKSSKLVLEKQLSILEKAREQNPDHPELQIVHLNILSMQMSDPTEILNAYEQALAQHPKNTIIWTAYIQRVLQHFALFTVSNARKVFERAIQVLQPVVRDVGSEVYHPSSLLLKYTSPEQKRDSRSMLQVFSLLTDYESATGHTEQAVALYQALLEFNWSSPMELSTRNLTAALAFFERFWDSDEPRLGEKYHIRGWREFYSESVANEVVQMSENPALVEAYKHGVTPPSDCFDDMIQHICSIREIPPYIKDAEYSRKLQPAEEVVCPIMMTTSETVSEEVEQTEDRPDTSASMYSNVHGYRIEVPETYEASEYERILKDLRGEDVDDTEKYKSSKKGLSRLKPTDERLENQNDVDQTDPLLQWLSREQKSCIEQWAPLRESDPTAEKQPDRVIFFEEIRPYLFRVDASLNTELLFQFLARLGVHYPYRQGISHTRLSTDYSNVKYMDVLTEPLLKCFPLDQSDIPAHSVFQLDTAQILKLLDRILSEPVYLEEIAYKSASRVVFIRNVFHRALSLLGSSIDIYRALIEFESQVAKALGAGDQARRVAQSLMRSCPESQTDLRFWAAYANLEVTHGQRKEAVRVCDKALSICPSLSSDAQLEGHRLLYIWSRVEFGHSELERLRTMYTLSLGPMNRMGFVPLSKLLKKSKKKPSEPLRQALSSVRILQIRQLYQSQMDEIEWGTENDERNFYCVHNAALFAYLASGYDRAKAIYDSAIQKVKDSSSSDQNVFESHPLYTNRPSSLEWLHAARLSLQLIHSRRSLLRPKVIRETIFEAVYDFPRHAIFLRLLINAHSNSSASQHLRLHFQQIQEQRSAFFDVPDPIEWIFAIVSEICRSSATSEINSNPMFASTKLELEWGKVPLQRVVNLVTQSLESFKCQGVPFFWRLYLRLMLRSGHVTDARKSLIRAIHRCPWAKILYLDGIQILRPYSSRQELIDLIELGLSKELYFRENADNFAKDDA